jgi:hypothetical protein
MYVVYVYMYVCMYVCIYVCVYVCMYVCVHVCVHVCMYVCTCVFYNEPIAFHRGKQGTLTSAFIVMREHNKENLLSHPRLHAVGFLETLT